MSKKEELSFEKVWAMFQEVRELQKETDRQMKENAMAHKENDKHLSWLDKQLGDIGRSMGEIVELVVIPGICKKMNDYGYCFTRIGPNRIIDRENGKTLTEIDLLLENGKESMAVEIKTDLSVKWVNRHLERLKLLRKNESITGLKGKVLYGAVAGISIDTDARELALENGMYVISIIENEDRLEVTAPAKRNIGKW